MKKILQILLVLLLVCSFVSCAKTSNDGGNKTDIESILGGETTVTPTDDKTEPIDVPNLPFIPTTTPNEEVKAVKEEIIDFGESLAGVKYDGKWGYINMDGEFVIEPQYNSVYTFNYGAAVVEIDDVPMLINKNNEVLFCGDLEYFEIERGNEGMFKTKLFTKYGFINHKGEVIAEPIYYNLGDFSQGLCVALNAPHDGFIDKSGEYVIEPIFNDAEDFSEGFAIVWKDGKCGFINTKGEQIVDFIYNGAEDFSDGMAKVKVGKLWGFIDTTGRVVIEPQFEHYVSSFSEGLAQFLMYDKEEDVNFYGYINKTGKVVIEPKFDIAEDFHDGCALVVVDPFEEKSISYIDKNGNFITDLKFEEAESFNEGLARVSVDSKWGFINTDGEIVVDLIYDEACDFSNGLAAVCIYDYDNDTEKWGYVDKTGKMVIEPIFDLAKDFEVIPEN